MFDALILFCMRLHERTGSPALIALLISPALALCAGLFYDWQLAGYILLITLAFAGGFAIVDAISGRVKDIRLQRSDPPGYVARMTQRNIEQLSVNAVRSHRRMLSPRKFNAGILLLCGLVLLAGAYGLSLYRQGRWQVKTTDTQVANVRAVPAQPTPKTKKSKAETREPPPPAAPTPVPPAPSGGAEISRTAPSPVPTPAPEVIQAPVAKLSEEECHKKILLWRDDPDTFVPSECQQQLAQFAREMREREAAARQMRQQDEFDRRGAQRYEDIRQRERGMRQQEQIEAWRRTGENIYDMFRRSKRRGRWMR